MSKVITTELQHSGASAANITLDSSKNVTVANNLTVTGAVSGSNYAGRNLIICPNISFLPSRYCIFFRSSFTCFLAIFPLTFD